MRAITNLCERILVPSSGQKIAASTPKKISRNQDVIAAYLGNVMDAGAHA